MAGARHVLLVGAVRHGHCVLPLPFLLQECGRLLDLPPFTVYDVLLNNIQSEEPAFVVTPQQRVNFSDVYDYDHVNFFLSDEEASSFISKREVHEQERGIADDIVRIRGNESPHPLQEMIRERGEDAVLEDAIEGLSSGQVEALRLCLREKLVVITGGPGVGKTATVTRIMKLFEQHGLSTLVCAPTGRAAIRLQELSGIPASTVHRLLECAAGFTFQRNEENPLNCQLLVIDEFSMMDLALTHALFRAIPSNALVVVVGDPDQLPSVGPGNVLRVGIVHSPASDAHHSPHNRI